MRARDIPTIFILFESKYIAKQKMCVILKHKKNNALLFVENDAVTNCGHWKTEKKPKRAMCMLYKKKKMRGRNGRRRSIKLDGSKLTISMQEMQTN